MDERLRRVLISAISLTIMVMAVTFIIYVITGFAKHDPAVECLVEAFVIGGTIIGGLAVKIWIRREFWGVKRGGFMQGYRRKPYHED